MTIRTCPLETELRDLIANGQWPLAASPDLLAHSANCRSCADLVLVANAFQSARAATTSTARLIPPGILWWRAQLRRRNEAVEQLARPLLSAQIFALAVALLAGAGFAASQARSGVAWLTWLQALPQSTMFQWNQLRSTFTVDPPWSLVTLILVLGTFMLLAGLAVYLATDRQ